jgi:hypothetical protein
VQAKKRVGSVHRRLRAASETAFARIDPADENFSTERKGL